MPKALKQDRIYAIAPIIAIIIGAVFFIAHRTESASEWEKMTNPEGFGAVEIHDVVAHFNEDLNQYYVWAAGGLDSDSNNQLDTGVIFTYDPNNRIWLGWKTTTEACDNFQSISFLYDKNDAEGDNAPYRLWVSGGGTNYGCTFYNDTGGYNDWHGNKYEGNQLGGGQLNGITMAYKNPGQPESGYDIWTVGNGQGIQVSTNVPPTTSENRTWTSVSGAPVGVNLNGVYAINKDNVWAVGNAGKICHKINAINWDGCAVHTINGNPNLTDVVFTDENHGWASINSNSYALFEDANWNINPQSTGLAAGSLMKAVGVVKHTTGDHFIWFSGEDGKIIYGKNNAGWYSQATDTKDTIFGITAVNRTHAWAVGENSTILKISPGNVAGWGYIGADNCDGYSTNPDVCVSANPAGSERQFPLGWISFNCANNDVCDTTTFSYGVNVKREKEGSTLTSCRDATPDEAGDQDQDVGALSGYAWLGMTDGDEYNPNPTITCAGGVCSNNPDVNCATDDYCRLCKNNDESCYASAWLSFDRDDIGNPPATPYNTFPIITYCGKTINLLDAENYMTAQFNYKTYAVDGWGRFKLGQCSDNPAKACFLNGECGGGNTCLYKGQGRCLNTWNVCITNADCDGQPCDFAKGWVRLRSDISKRVTDPAGPFARCNACKTIDPDPDPDPPEEYDGDEYMVCEICEINTTGANDTCNNCDIDHCGTGRCPFSAVNSASEDPCIVYPVAEQGQKDYCIKAGLGACVYNDNNDPTAVECDKCKFCDVYGVSVDMEGGKWYGKAYSEDFGWIDVSRAGLYSQAWLRAIYGDIYAKISIGSPKMAKAPGYDTAGEACNATYLVLAGDRMYNFCTEAEPVIEGQSQFRTVPSYQFPAYSGANPWLVEGYRAFDMPTGTSVYSVLGKIDFNKMATGATETNKSKISDYPSGLFNSPVDLAGRTFHFTHSRGLDINQKISFKKGNTGSVKDGSGMILVDLNLYVNHDITYDDSGVTTYKEVPSVAFYVKGDMEVGPDVDQIVGTYYVEGDFITKAAAKQLKVDGLIIAGGFDLNRTYIGTIEFPMPAELITYDGRIQINPPPGFRDLSSALPKFREVTP
ncbi:MAG: hypothetical protein V1701_10315 [Planctomycetota bacterium]